MNVKFCKAFLLVATVGLSLQVAADDNSSTVKPVSERVVNVGVPQSEIALEPIRYKPPNPVEFEFSLSSWAPRNFNRGSFTGQPSPFTRGDIPALAVNRLSQIVAYSHLAISSKLGLGYVSLERSEGTNFANIQSGASEQNLNMLMMRIGAEVAWANVLPWGFEPNLSASVAPTWISATESVYERSVSAMGFPLEGTAGLVWRSGGRGGISRGDLSLGVAGQAMTGTVAGSNMTGYGIEGMLRLSL